MNDFIEELQMVRSYAEQALVLYIMVCCVIRPFVTNRKLRNFYWLTVLLNFFFMVHWFNF